MGKLFSKRKNKSSGHHHRGFDALDQGGQCTDTFADHMDRGYHPPAGQLIHSDAVSCLAPVKAGLCLSGSKDQTVALYDYYNHKLEQKWMCHDREVTKVCYGQACDVIFSASRDKQVRLLKRGNPDVVSFYTGHELVVTALAVNADNTVLCTGSRDNTVKLWDVGSCQCIRENNIHRNLVTDVKFIPGTETIIQTGEDKEVRIFDSRTLEVVHNFPRKQYIQMCCDVSKDGYYCVTCSNGFGGNGCEATLWDLRERKIVHEFKGHTEAIESCIFLPLSGRPLIATSSRDFSVKIWDRDSKACITDCVISGSGPLTSLICYEDYSLCVSSFNLGIFQLKLEDNKLHQVTSF